MYVFIKTGLAPAAGSLWLRGLMEISFKKQIFVNLMCSFLSSSTCCSHRVYNTIQGLGPPWPLIGQGPRERLWCDGNDKNSSVRSPAAFWEHSPHLLTESMCAAGPHQGHREPSSAELITVHFKSSFVPGSLARFFLSHIASSKETPLLFWSVSSSVGNQRAPDSSSHWVDLKEGLRANDRQ